MNYLNKNDFDKAYIKGYDIEKIVPSNIDINVVKEWTEEQKIIFFQQNEGNFLIACIADETEDEDVIYSFMRFFSLGDNTQCSVDFQSSTLKEMIFKLTQLLTQKFSF